jgi:BMFP domain-containing protein YqiC
MAERFVASAPGGQLPVTVRQFRELQDVLARVEARISELEARVAALEAAP